MQLLVTELYRILKQELYNFLLSKNFILLFFKSSPRDIFLIAFRERGRGKRKQNTDGREKHQLAGSHTCSDRGSNPQPTYVLWPGFEPALWRMRQRSEEPSNTSQRLFCLLLVKVIFTVGQLLKDVFAPWHPDLPTGIKRTDFRGSPHTFQHSCLTYILWHWCRGYTAGATCSCAKHTKATFKSCKPVLDLLSILKGRNTNLDFNNGKRKFASWYISTYSPFNSPNRPNMLTFLRTPSWVLDSLSKTGGRNLDIMFCNCSSVSAWPSRKKTRSSWSVM